MSCFLSSLFGSIFKDKCYFRCLENGGEKVLDEYLEEQEQLVWCVMEHFDLETIQNEIEKKKKSGDLDEVFRKYCG